MRALGPGNVVADLIIVCLVVPRPARVRVIRVVVAAKVDFRDAVVVVRPSEDAVRM